MTKKKPTASELASIAWWNSLTDHQRLAALKAARTTIPAEAFAYHKKIARWAEVAAKALARR
jgi:hypothetical protein